MTTILRQLNTYIKSLALVTMVGLATANHTASAFSLATYADNSVLADGRWVKISVKATGIHFISAEKLQQWGFSDPKKVHVYGYGGKQISNELTRVNYIDDLPQLQSVNTAKGVYFYAVGPISWTKYDSQHYSHSRNPFSDLGYYFLSDREADDLAIVSDGSAAEDGEYETTFIDRILHEVDEFSPGRTGHNLYGEDFKYTPSRTFTFDLVDRDPDASKVWMRHNFFAKTYGSASTLKFTANGSTLPQVSGDNVPRSDNSSYCHGMEKDAAREFEASGDRLSIGVTYSSPVTVYEARLDYITINYTRKLKLRNGNLDFSLSNPRMTISGATASTHLWDVTNPLAITAVKTSAVAGGVNAVNAYNGNRDYVAWDESGSFPSPELCGEVGNQNLHAEPVPDMVIFTIGEWASQAERIAEYHRNSADSLKVLVVDQELVFNEFGSGVPDVGAFRKMLKMFWDRTQLSGKGNEDGTRFVLLMGRPFFDNRRLTQEGKILGYPTMPTWETNTSVHDNTSYTTDDILAFLKDSSGRNMLSDTYCLSVGRLPVRSLAEATAAVDKLMRYNESMPAGTWQNRMMLVADDGDNSTHARQTEEFWKSMLIGREGGNFYYDKVYIDEYVKTNNSYPGARSDIFRMLDEGVWWWNYVGHANMTEWTHEKLLTSNDMNNLYLKRYPILYAATCDYLRWDESAISGAEVMWQLERGGTIATIAATRPVLIQQNGELTKRIGSEVGERDHLGRLRTIGEIYTTAKGYLNQDNKLRFVLLGDPAMRMVVPDNLVKITAVNGKKIDEMEIAPIIQARDEMIIEGVVTNGVGDVLDDFTGQLYTTIYDAEYTVTTRNNAGDGGDNGTINFEKQGLKLYSGVDSVNGGHFKIRVVMPSEIADNFRPGAINFNASSTDRRTAMGCHRDIYFYGYNNNAEPDTEAPVIDAMYLNHAGFKNGDKVNESPMLVAKLSDNLGINLSQAGVGHQMTAYLDDTRTFTDVSNYYTPASDGSIGGTVMYQFDNLSTGAHSLRLRVWDIAGNMTEQTIEFFVDEKVAPTIVDVYTDANPASVEANFYVTHDRPDQMVTVTIEVFNLLGQTVWTSTTSGLSDMSQSTPVKWNLTDMAGNRVNRGIYLYRASITTDGEKFNSASRRIAVTSAR